MTEAKLAPNLPDWMVQHANRYLSSGGTDGHMYKTTLPGRGEITTPALLLTTTGRKWREVHIPAVLRNGRRHVLRRRFEGRCARTPRVVPQHPRQPGCGGPGRDQEAEGASQDSDGRGTRATLEEVARILASVRRLRAQDRTRDTGRRAGPCPLGYRRLAAHRIVRTLPSTSSSTPSVLWDTMLKRARRGISQSSRTCGWSGDSIANAGNQLQRPRPISPGRFEAK